MTTQKGEKIAYIYVVNLEIAKTEQVTHLTKEWETLFDIGITYKTEDSVFWEDFFGRDYAMTEARADACANKKCAIMWLRIKDPKKREIIPIIQSVLWTVSYRVFVFKTGIYGPLCNDDFTHMLNFMMNSPKFPEFKERGN